MKFLKVAKWWAVFTILWWGIIFVAIILSPINGDSQRVIPLSPREGAEYLAQTYGLGLYIALSVILIIVTSLSVCKKRK